MITLYITAISLGFIHTILGPDHYAPFIALSKARDWNANKTFWITFVCGLGHILSSVILGFIGISFGLAVNKLEIFEATRAGIASWFLICFGLVYFAWGLKRAFDKKHSHKPFSTKGNLTFWAIFIIFVLGPCEPLIPILIYPAAKGSIVHAIGVALAFGGATLITMLSVVMLSYKGFGKFSFAGMERFSHAIAGFIVFMCGFSVKFLGL